MFGRDLYYPRRRRFARFPSWVDYDSFDDDFLDDMDLDFDFGYSSFRRHVAAMRRRMLDLMDFEASARFPRRSAHEFLDDFPRHPRLTFPEFADADMSQPEEVRVKLLPGGRMAVTGNSQQSRSENGTTFRSMSKFYRSMDVPDDLDVAHLKSMMDENNELTIKRPEKLISVDKSPCLAIEGRQERIIPA